MEHSVSLKKAFLFAFTTWRIHAKSILGFIATWLGISLTSLILFAILGASFSPRIEVTSTSTAFDTTTQEFQEIEITDSQLTSSAVFFLMGILLVLIFIMEFVFTAGLIKIGLEVYDSNNPLWHYEWFISPLLWRAVVGSLLAAVVSFAALFLLIIPGIYLGIALCFVPFFILDQRTDSIKKAFKLSFQATRTNIVLKLFFLEFLLRSLNTILFGKFFDFTSYGALLLFFATWLIGVPCIVWAHVFVYRHCAPRGSLHQ